MRSRRERARLPVLMFASLIAAVNGTLGAPLVPVIARSEHVSPETAQWTLTVTLIVGAVCTPVFGRLGDGRHPRRWLLVAMGLVAAGAALSAVAPNFEILLAGRALQGIAYGILPVCLSLLREVTPPEQLRPRVAALALTGATGLGLGYPLTATIAQVFGERAAFVFAVAFIILAALAVWLVLPSGGAVGHRPRLDLPGAVLLGACLATLLLAVSQGVSWGWTSVAVIGLLIASGALGWAWIARERRVPAPLVELRLLAHPAVLLANSSALLLGFAMFMGFSVITRLAQTPASTGYGLGVSLAVSGLLLSPMSIGSQASNRVSRLIARRFGMTAVLPLGAALAALPSLLLAFHHAHVWQLAVAMLLFGCGVGSTFVAMPALIVDGVPAHETGSATGFNSVLRMVGGAAGSAFSAVILGAYTSTGETYPRDAGYTIAFAVSAAACLTVLVGLLVMRQRTAVSAAKRATVSAS
jgi:MFS family permease